MTQDGILLLLGLLAVALLASAGWILYSRRATPGERERRRRRLVNRAGRMTDGTLTDIGEDTLYYSYSVMGVNYDASQDVSALEAQIPENHDPLIGPVALKYVPGNPANSILLCEKWSGLRTAETHLTTADSADG